MKIRTVLCILIILFNTKLDLVFFRAIVKNNTFLDFSVGLVPKEKLVKLIESHK